ncbi:hypothetical protein [Ornithinimicrobium murale]|uniref:hypothetical protein n=1 Tax=Ornithinimicrobium murale TaxID=1050153 RepID=UPI000E0CD444|nr:hypothetical protein [Ornithinimicrobium murale]
MAVITLCSAAGSPGVTTTALGLALAWPRPCLLVEADPTGGSAVLAGYFRGDVPQDSGVIDLVVANRDQNLTRMIGHASMPIPGSTASFLPGVRSHEQSRSVSSLWEPLVRELRGLERAGQDVIVDAGRLGLEGSPLPLVHGADLTLLATRGTLPALSAGRSRVRSMKEVTAHFGLLLIGEKQGVVQQKRSAPEGRCYDAGTVAKVLGAPVVSTVRWDRVAAGVLSRGEPASKKFNSSPLARSLRAANTAILAVLQAETESAAQEAATRKAAVQ